MDLWLFSPCSPSLIVWATMNHIEIGKKVHELSICTLKLSNRFLNLWFSGYLLVTFHLPSSLQLLDLRKCIEWVIFIQIRFRQLLWVLWDKRKRWEKLHFEIFRSIDCDLSTSSPISSNLNILVSAHPIRKQKIVTKSLRSIEDMVKNPFLYFEFFTSGNPCDSSPPPRRNHEPETSEKFSKHGFSFFNPNLPFSLETLSKCHIGFLF